MSVSNSNNSPTPSPKMPHTASVPSPSIPRTGSSKPPQHVPKPTASSQSVSIQSSKSPSVASPHGHPQGSGGHPLKTTAPHSPSSSPKGKQTSSPSHNSPSIGGSFSAALKDYPPPLPPHLLRKLSSKDTTSVGKVKVLLKVSQGGEVPGSCRVLSVDNRRRCVTLYDPATPSTIIPPTTITPTKIILTGAIPTHTSPTGILSAGSVPPSIGTPGVAPSSGLPPGTSIVPNGAIPRCPMAPEVSSGSTQPGPISSAGDVSIPNELCTKSMCLDTGKPTVMVGNSAADLKPTNGVTMGSGHISSNGCAAGANKSLIHSSESAADTSKVSDSSTCLTGDVLISGNSNNRSGTVVGVTTLPSGALPPRGASNLPPGLSPKEDHLCSATIKGVSAPKMYTFDGIYTHDDSQTELCSAALTDIIAAALRGAQGAVFTFGQPHLGQRDTMVGSPRSSHTLGALPSAICWLYRAMQEGAPQEGSAGGSSPPWTVTVSALQIGHGEQVMDLLVPFIAGAPSDGSPSLLSLAKLVVPPPSADDPPHGKDSCKDVSGGLGDSTPSEGLTPPTLLSKAIEVPAPTMAKAAQLLDFALGHRHVDEWGRPAHLVFSLNIYQQPEKGGVTPTTGCWGRLHLLDLGPVERGARGGSGGRAVTLSALGNTILAIINGQKQPPHKEVQLGLLGRIVRECVGSLRCVTSMIVHVSAEPHKYQDTLATIQLAARVHRLRRRRIKPQIGGSGSGGSSEESRSGRSSRGTITDTGSSSMDPSSSELSCDTVIYVGPGADDATDSEHPPVFLPSSSNPENRCSIRKALRGSSMDSTKIHDSPRTPRKVIPKKSPKHSSSGKDSSSPSKARDKIRDGDKSDMRDGVYNDASGDAALSPAQMASNKSPCKQCLQSGRSGSTSSPKFAKCLHGCRQRKSTPNENNLPQGPSDEQWVDGPRFHKSKVLESQKIKGYELETWIDGPEATYGYMDDVKKSMIQKWVETQNSQGSGKETHTRSPKHMPYKEMTQFKTSEHEDILSSPKHKDKHRDKRKSSDGRELRKESSKHSTSHTKDSPHRRRSYNGPHHRPEAVHDTDRRVTGEDANKVPDNGHQSKHINQVPEDVVASHGHPNSPRKESQISQHLETAKPVCLETVRQGGDADLAPKDPGKAHICTDNTFTDVQSVRKEGNVSLSAVTEVCPVVANNAEKDDEIRTAKEEVKTSSIEDTTPTSATPLKSEPQLDTTPTSATHLKSEPQLGRTELNSPEKTGSVSESSQEGVDAGVQQEDEEDTSQLSNEEAKDEEEYPEGRVFLRQLNGEEEPATTWEEYELIEVEEPLEPVELVDSWTQVTEEDLAAAAGVMLPYNVRGLQPPTRRLLLPPVQEEVEPSTDSMEDESEEASNSDVKAFDNEVSCDSSVAENPDDNQHLDPTPLADDICQVEFPGSTRFEEMIQGPTFMAKTHYFAQRLEELRKLHQFYKNLAKQAPRRNSTLLQSPTSGALPDLLLVPLDDELVMEGKGDIASGVLPQPLFNHEGTLSSLKMGSEYNFDWKSLLPEEIEAASESGDGRPDGEDSASDFSKEFNETVYDIQSDIMPYLPSNYISLSSLTAHRPPDLIMTSNLRYTASLQVPAPKEETRQPSPIAEDPVTETPSPLNITSLSDDETNVKHMKVKKEKRKKKLNLTTSTKKAASKETSEVEASSSFSKLSWSRFFGGPRRNSSPKESPKKSSKTSNKNSSKSQSSSSKNSEKTDKKHHKDRENNKDFLDKADKRTKDREITREEQRSSSRDLRNHRDSSEAGIKTPKIQHKSETEKSKSKSSSRKSSDHRTGGSNASSSGRSSKRESSSREGPHNSSKQDLSGRSRCTVFQREALCFHPSSSTSSMVHPGYDSGADSGVGLRVSTSRAGRRSQNGASGSGAGASDCRHGESSGYESVMRDSECSSFGSSQDSGLDDEANPAVATKELVDSKHLTQSKCSTKTEPSKIVTRQKLIQDTKHLKEEKSCPTVAPPTDSTYEPGFDVCESVDLSAVAPSGRENCSELREYTEEDVARYEARRHHEVEGTPRTNGRTPGRIEVKPETARLLSNSEPPTSEEQIRQLRETQNQLKSELEAAKTRLMIDKSRWSYELHVEAAMSPHQDGFLEALEAETTILRKRVTAASSRCMLESCFLNRKHPHHARGMALKHFEDHHRNITKGHTVNSADRAIDTAQTKNLSSLCPSTELFSDESCRGNGDELPSVESEFIRSNSVGDEASKVSADSVSCATRRNSQENTFPFRRRKSDQERQIDGAGDSVRLSGVQL